MEGVVRGPDPDFWRGKKVLVTGHTGFKGAWLTLWLHRLGAEVSAFALVPQSGPSLYELAGIAGSCRGVIQNLLEPTGVVAAVRDARPQVVLHLAAQALVRQSLVDPAETFASNVMGTTNLLDALRDSKGLEAIVAVTSDKVYANDNSGRPLREGDHLGGHDPYSASKAACEHVIHAYAGSYFTARNIPVASARGGNVIGGGDFARDRIVPDCVRAALQGDPVLLRHPESTRPWQHVLDCLCGYLLFAENLVQSPDKTPRALNFGPQAGDDISVAELAAEMLAALDALSKLELASCGQSIEATKLALDCTLARQTLGWQDRLVGRSAIAASAAWYRKWHQGDDMRSATLSEIESYQAGMEVCP